MIDIHAHITPGLDDGADNTQDALEMVRIAQECKVTAIVATPHCNQEGFYDNFFTEELIRSWKKLRSRVRAAGLEVEILPGMEIFYSEDLKKKIRDRAVIGLNDTGYYLIEFPFDISPERLKRELRSVLEPDRVVPVIAHPERYYCVQRDPQLIYQLVMDGCVTQVNKGSIAGKFGKEAYYAAMELLEYNLVGCVASDAHTSYMRTTHMEEVYDFLEKQYSTECAELLLHDNPEKIIQNQKLGMRAAARPVRKRYFR